MCLSTHYRILHKRHYCAWKWRAIKHIDDTVNMHASYWLGTIQCQFGAILKVDLKEPVISKVWGKNKQIKIAYLFLVRLFLHFCALVINKYPPIGCQSFPYFSLFVSYSTEIIRSFKEFVYWRAREKTFKNF